jgi:hypothetical protein
MKTVEATVKAGELGWLGSVERVKGIESEDRVQPDASKCGFTGVFAGCVFDEKQKNASSRTLFDTARHYTPRANFPATHHWDVVSNTGNLVEPNTLLAVEHHGGFTSRRKSLICEAKECVGIRSGETFLQDWRGNYV